MLGAGGWKETHPDTYKAVSEVLLLQSTTRALGRGAHPLIGRLNTD